MFVPAARVQAIRESPSTQAAQRVRDLRAAGRTIVDLTVGEPDFDTPDHVKAAAVAAMDAGLTKYTPVNGIPALREAIAAKVLRRTGQAYGGNEIAVGGGAKQVIFLALMAGIDPGDEVIIPAPYWVSYPDMVAAHGGVPVVVPCREADGFRLTPETLEAAITPRTRWLVLNAPGNPTGTALHAATSWPPSPRCSTGTHGWWCCATRSTTRSRSPTGPPPASSPSRPGCGSGSCSSTGSPRPTR